MTDKTQNFQEQFLDELLLEAGFTADDNLDLLKQDLKPILQERITMSIYNDLSQEQRDTVTEFMDGNKIDELNKYLQETISDYHEKIMEICADFEEEYLENMES